MTKKALLIYSTVNRPGRKDATGAFIPAAKKAKEYLQERGVEVTMLPMLGMNRAKIASVVGLTLPDTVAFFCHGTRDSLQVWGKQANDLGTLFFDFDVRRAVFFCCSLADPRKEDNFINRLMRTYCDWVAIASYRAEGGGLTVLAHTTAGHTTNNPNVVTVWSQTALPGSNQAPMERPGTAAFKELARKLRKENHWLTFLHQ